MSKYELHRDMLIFWCPGCEEPHGIRVEGPDAWHWDEATMTAAPSVLVRGGLKERCHLFIRNGCLEYLSDSNHALAGKIVSMEAV